MSEEIYFTAQEVVAQIDGLHSISTLNKWANFIQKHCVYEFQSTYITFEVLTRRGRKKKHRKTRVFSSKEVAKLQQVALLIPSLGRELALRKLFDQNYQFNSMQHHELMGVFFQELAGKCKRYEQRFSALETKLSESYTRESAYRQRLKQVEEQVAMLQEDNSSGWFRRKR